MLDGVFTLADIGLSARWDLDTGKTRESAVTFASMSPWFELLVSH